MTMTDEVGGGLTALLAKDRRRRVEATQAEACGELAGLLLPLSLSLARLAARRAVLEGAAR